MRRADALAHFRDVVTGAQAAVKLEPTTQLERTLHTDLTSTMASYSQPALDIDVATICYRSGIISGLAQAYRIIHLEFSHWLFNRNLTRMSPEAQWPG